MKLILSDTLHISNTEAFHIGFCFLYSSLHWHPTNEKSCRKTWETLAEKWKKTLKSKTPVIIQNKGNILKKLAGFQDILPNMIVPFLNTGNPSDSFRRI